MCIAHQYDQFGRGNHPDVARHTYTCTGTLCSMLFHSMLPGFISLARLCLQPTSCALIEILHPNLPQFISLFKALSCEPFPRPWALTCETLALAHWYLAELGRHAPHLPWLQVIVARFLKPWYHVPPFIITIPWQLSRGAMGCSNR